MPLGIEKLKGMTPEMRVKLNAIGVKSADDFFSAALTPEGRQKLAESTSATPEVILELANRADLSRIKGVAGIYSDLLEEAGVDTVKELKARVPENLHAKLLEINQAKNLTPKPPALKTVKTWVALARRRRKFLQY